MTCVGSCKIWILVNDWSRFQSSEPDAGDVTRNIGPLYFIKNPKKICIRCDKVGSRDHRILLILSRFFVSSLNNFVFYPLSLRVVFWVKTIFVYLQNIAWSRFYSESYLDKIRISTDGQAFRLKTMQVDLLPMHIKQRGGQLVLTPL